METETRVTTMDEIARKRVMEAVEYARQLGYVVTVEQVARKPLAMGNYSTVVSVREARNK